MIRDRLRRSVFADRIGILLAAVGMACGLVGAEGDELESRSSAEAQAARQRLRPSPGLEVRLWAGEPLAQNLTSIDFDDAGHAYVVETGRRRTSVFDVRNLQPWLEDDFALRTVRDRQDLLTRLLTPGEEGYDAFVAAVTRSGFGDFNGDGTVDSRDLTVESERIRLVWDADGDGRADRSRVFADGFNSPVSGVAAGVLAQGTNVWFTSIPDLWRFPAANGVGGRRDAGGVVRGERLLTGFGVHIAFGGHDLHGLVRGPDGRLYFSIADRGAWVTNREGRVIALPDTGAVFRCETDGTRMEVVARGLRNPQELAFDEAGNLWTGDNNGDGGDKARWTLVLEGADYGWSIGWQWLPRMGAWNSERLWHLRGSNTAASIVPPVAHVGHGPAGLAYYPGTGLGARFRDHFFLADFPGGVRVFRVEPDGAFFRVAAPPEADGTGWMEDNSAARPEGKLLWDLYPVDVTFPPFGGVMVADWVRGWEKTGQGRLWHVVDPAATDAEAVAEVRGLLAAGMHGVSKGDLLGLLGHADQRIRLAAQWELADRGKRVFDDLRDRALGPDGSLARRHALWGMGQIVRRDPEGVDLDDLRKCLPLLEDDDLEVRIQAARFLGEAGLAEAHPVLLKLIGSRAARVSAQAMFAYRDLFRALDPDDPDRFIRARASLRERLVGGLPGMFQHRVRAGAVAGRVLWPTEAVAERLQQPDADDPVLRHAAAALLAQVGRVATRLGPGLFRQNAGGMVTHAHPRVRLAWLLAERELLEPRVETFLEDPHPVLVLEAARAIHDRPIPSALPRLAGLLRPGALDHVRWPEGDSGIPFTPEEWRTWVLRRAANAAFRIGDPASAEALAGVATRDDVPVEVRREALEALEQWAAPPPRDRVVGLHRPLAPRGADPARSALAGVWENLPAVSTPGPVVLAALKAASSLQVGGIDEALVVLAAHPDPAVSAEVERRREAGETVGIADLARRIDGPDPVRAQAALADLARRPGGEVDAILADWMDKLQSGAVAPGLRLDVLEAAARREAPGLREKVERYRAGLPQDDPLAPYRTTLAGGDPVRGRRLFAERADWGCQRCHRLDGAGGDVGPELTGLVRTRGAGQVLESIVHPNARLAPGYETAILTLKDGTFLSGIVAAQTASAVVLKTAEDGEVTVARADIASSEVGPSAMPEGLVEMMSLFELRDLLAALGADGK